MDESGRRPRGRGRGRIRTLSPTGSESRAGSPSPTREVSTVSEPSPAHTPSSASESSPAQKPSSISESSSTSSSSAQKPSSISESSSTSSSSAQKPSSTSESSPAHKTSSTSGSSSTPESSSTNPSNQSIATSVQPSTIQGSESTSSGGTKPGSDRPAAVPSGATRGTTSSGSVDDHVDNDYVESRPKGKDKTGKKGPPIKMRVNFYKLNTLPAWALYQYHVDFEPLEDRIRVKKILFRELVENQKMGISYMFDGQQLFTPKHLRGEDGQPMQGGQTRTYISEGIRYKGKENEEHYDMNVTIRYVKRMAAGSPIYNQLYNVLVKKCLFGMELELIGRNFFDYKAAIKVPQQRLELWPGFITSMRPHEESVLLCVEVTHKVLRQDKVLDLIKQIKITKKCGNDRSTLSTAVNDELRNTIVMTMYNHKTYHVDEVDFGKSPLTTFEKKGVMITYADYYKTRYGLEIQDMNQPLLMSKPRSEDLHEGEERPAYLVPELCQSTGLTDDMRADFRLMKSLSEYLHQGPGARIKEIEHFMKRLMASPEIKRELQGWGLEFDRTLVDLTGRIMPSESTIFANNALQPVDQKGDFTMAFRSKQMLSAVNLERWAVVVPQRDAGGVDNLVRTMAKVSSPLSMKLANPKEVIKAVDGRVHTYLQILEDTLKKIPNIQMFFVILPNNKLDLYAAVKKRLAVEHGILSQCFLAKNVTNKGLMSIATKVVVQMNAKLGGEPWTIKLPLKNTMFIGFDVYGGAKGSKAGNIGAMVATYSKHFTKYFSTTSIHHTRTDLSENMRNDMTKCLIAYREENGCLPERIIFYRDGVGEGQLKFVFEQELEQLKKELAKRYAEFGEVPAKLTYIVVTKKINARVFMEKQTGTGYDNPPPGSVVDTVVTLRERFDFYLISCAARQGTVSPCSYNVLCDESDFEVDRIQQITFKLCHMYFNWSGTIAVPAPCRYAHKLAFLTGIAYSSHTNVKLSKLLHFL